MAKARMYNDLNTRESQAIRCPIRRKAAVDEYRLYNIGLLNLNDFRVFVGSLESCVVFG